MSKNKLNTPNCNEIIKNPSLSEVQEGTKERVASAFKESSGKIDMKSLSENELNDISFLYELFKKIFGKEFEYISRHHNILGEPVFKVKQDGKYYIIFGNKISDAFDSVSWPDEIAGKIVFIATDNGKQYIINGNTKSKAYDHVFSPIEIGGKLATKVKLNLKEYLLWGDIMSKPYHHIINISIKEGNNGTPQFSVEDGSGEPITIYRGQEP